MDCLHLFRIQEGICMPHKTIKMTLRALKVFSDNLPGTMWMVQSPLWAQNCLQTLLFPGLCFISLCGKLEREPKKKELRGPQAEEEPLYKQFITLLQRVSPLSPHVSLPLPLFPLLFFLSFSLSSCSPLFLSVPTKYLPPPLQTPQLSPPSAAVSRSLSNPGGESFGSVMAYGYLTSASPLIRLSSLNDATCGATNATEKSIKAFH